MRAKAAVLLSRTFVFAPKVFLEQPVIIVPPAKWGPEPTSRLGPKEPRDTKGAQAPTLAGNEVT
jgi:hypothetical protein